MNFCQGKKSLGFEYGRQVTWQSPGQSVSRCPFILPCVISPSGNINCETTIHCPVALIMSQFETLTIKEKLPSLFF